MTVCTKDKIKKVINSLPADTSIEEAMERLYLLSKIEKGIQEADAGKTVSHEEVRRKLKKWLE